MDALRPALSIRASGLFCVLGLLAGCSRGPVAGAGSAGPDLALAAEDETDFGPLPDFRLTSSSGELVTKADLLGRPLVFAALFTTCSGPCPRLAAGLRELQSELAGTDVLLVAVSVDPEHDTPAVLERYAEAVGAQRERWIFLTGEEAEVHRLVREGFYLAVERAAPGEAGIGEQVTHDTRFLVVDRTGRRRGWYPGTDPAALQSLRERVLFLARE